MNLLLPGVLATADSMNPRLIAASTCATGNEAGIEKNRSENGTTTSFNFVFSGSYSGSARATSRWWACKARRLRSVRWRRRASSSWRRTSVFGLPGGTTVARFALKAAAVLDAWSLICVVRFGACRISSNTAGSVVDRRNWYAFAT